MADKEQTIRETLAVYGQIIKFGCKLLCCPPCPSSIVSKIAFQPPKPSKYQIQTKYTLDRPNVKQLIFHSDFVNTDSSCTIEPAFIPRKRDAKQANAFALSNQAFTPIVDQPESINSNNRSQNQHLNNNDPRLIVSGSTVSTESSTTSGVKSASDTSTTSNNFFYKKPEIIAGCYIRCHKPKKSNFVILHSHGNAVDMGEMVPFLQNLSDLLLTDIFSYDYTGYGNSDKETCSEADIYTDINRAYEFLKENYGFHDHQIILYGQSIGTVATVDLASKLSVEGVELAGVVLHSPLKTGLSVMKKDPGCCLKCISCNPLDNESKISKINSKTLIIHGTCDEVLAFEHGQTLFDNLKSSVKVAPLWVEGGGHNDIESAKFCRKYISRMQEFIRVDLGADVDFEIKIGHRGINQNRPATPSSRRKAQNRQTQLPK